MNLNFPNTGLVQDYKLYRTERPSITLALKRDVVAPVLFRNSHPDRSETQEFNNTLHAQVNGEKFVAKERLTGLALLRRLSNTFGDENDAEWGSDTTEVPPGLISPDYKYNEPAGLTTSLNLDALTYGLAGTGDQEFGIKSHVIEGYTYSTDEYDLMNKETRNAVYESGTMQNEDGEQSSSLFEYAKIHPGNSFVHFITLEAATPAMVLYALHNLRNTTDYGARETRSGRTLKNNVVAVILGEANTTLSTGELLLDYRTDAPITEDIASYIEDVRRTDWEVYSDELSEFDGFPDWYHSLNDVASRTADAADQLLYDQFRAFTETGYRTLIHGDA